MADLTAFQLVFEIKPTEWTCRDCQAPATDMEESMTINDISMSMPSINNVAAILFNKSF